MAIATGILVMVALTAGGTLAAAVVYAFITRGRDWWRELFSVRLLPFVFVGLAIGATTLAIGYASKHAADDALRLAVADIEADCDDHLSLLLHADAGVIVDAFAASNRLDSAELARLSELLSVDEATIFDASGSVVSTIDPGLKIGDRPMEWGREEMKPYAELLTGRRETVRQRFRPSVSAPDRLMKYFGMALPGGGALQVGYHWSTFEREFPRFFQPLFEQRVIGERGFCLVIGRGGRLLVGAAGHPEAAGKSAAEIGLTPRDLAEPSGRVFHARLFGTRCRCTFYEDEIAGRRILAAVPLSERQEPAMALACGVAFVFWAAYVGFRLILRKFRLQQKRIDDLRSAEESRRAEDMALARAVQRAELRTDGMKGDGYRLRALMDAAREVGGDFYDYYELPDGRFALTIADVSGKGIPAALFMMKSRMTLRACVLEHASLAEAVAAANVLLARKNPAELFVTAWVGVWDRATGRLEYVSAGHNPPVVKRADGAVAWLPAPRCAALGVFEKAKYRAAETRLGEGDGIFLYTDGVTEAMDTAGTLFGNERLEEAVRDSEYPLVPSVISAVGAFTAGAEQSDDITMLELHVSARADCHAPPHLV